MKKSNFIKYMISLCVLVLAVSAWFGTKQVAGAVQKLEEFEAYYKGSAVEVGEEINLADIYLSAKYYIYSGQTGYTDYEDVKKGFTITPSKIEKKGDNRILVTYKEKTAVLIVPGKEVESITADYVGDELYVGTTIPVGKIDVYAYFSDGTYDKVKGFTLSEPTVIREGMNTVTVTYKGKSAPIFVLGKAPLAIEELTAYYMGNMVIEGNAINKGDIVVEAIYNDGTVKKITNFNISPSIAELEGENDITVSYGEASTVIQVPAEARYITEMRARYTGSGVIIGKSVKKEEIEVIVTYNDGSDEAIDNYEMQGAEILFEGENLVLIYCDSFMADIVVPGVKGFAANYDNALSNYFMNEEYSWYTEVTLGMNLEVEPGKFMLRAADSDVVKYVVQRALPAEEFLGFELAYDDDEMVLEFPMAMKVTVPDGIEPEQFGVYYTPNQSTILAKVDGEFLGEEQNEYEFIVYEPGMYILVREDANRLVTEIVVDTKLELRVNRNYSLNPVVFPLSAENRTVSFYSTDEDVATVTEKGKIRTHSEGTCEIWIEAQDDSGVYVIVTVEVKKGK